MPTGQGYFLSPDGKAIPIFEHLMAVEADPARFGLRPEDVAAQTGDECRNREARRVRVLTLVLRNGFSRVRFDGRRNVVEFYAGTPEDEARRRGVIARFLEREGIAFCVVKNIRYALPQLSVKGGQT